MIPNQTATDVQTEKQLLDQRRLASATDHNVLAGINAFSQILIGISLYLYGQIGTPGYFSIILAAPFALLLLIAASVTAKKAAQGYEKRKPGLLIRLSLLLCFLYYLFEAQLIFFSLCSILFEILPGQSGLGLAVLMVVLIALSFFRNRSFALPALARILVWVIAALIGYCIFSALPHGKQENFFPLLGYGAKSIFHGAVWIFGAVSGVVLPIVFPSDNISPSVLSNKYRILFLPSLISMGCGVLAMLISAWLTPIYAMMQPETVGWRLMLLTNMTPSVPAWSMEVIGKMLLFFTSLSFCILRAASALEKFSEREKHHPFLSFLLLSILVPAGIAESSGIEKLFLILAPYRSAAVILILFLFLLSGLRANKKAGKEVSP